MFFEISTYVLSIYSTLSFPFLSIPAQQQKLSSKTFGQHIPVSTFLSAEFRHTCFLSSYLQAACIPTISTILSAVYKIMNEIFKKTDYYCPISTSTTPRRVSPMSLIGTESGQQSTFENPLPSDRREAQATITTLKISKTYKLSVTQIFSN